MSLLGDVAKGIIEHKKENVQKKLGIHPTNYGPIPMAPHETSPEPSAQPMSTVPSYTSGDTM